MTIANGSVSALLAAMPESIGDLTYATPEWVDVAREVLNCEVERHKEHLSELDRFTFCRVAHNAPQFLHGPNTLAFSVTIRKGHAEIVHEELPVEECDIKTVGDHSLMSNMARIVSHGKDPKLIQAAASRFPNVGRFEHTENSDVPTIASIVWERVHDAMAERTMPRFVFMTPEWVSSARAILTTRANSKKYRDTLLGVDFLFSENFSHTPRYAFPDGSNGGFWVRCREGQLQVGAGPVPDDFDDPDFLTSAMYTPVIPVGRTVNAVMTDEEKKAQEAYVREAFRYDKELSMRPVEQTQPSGAGPMPEALARVMMPLHDELSKRTSGEHPKDYDSSIKPAWAQTLSFDRHPDYDPSWLRYDEFDIYGNPLD